jgi:hypothetical protein
VVASRSLPVENAPTPVSFHLVNARSDLRADFYDGGGARLDLTAAASIATGWRAAAPR